MILQLSNYRIFPDIPMVYDTNSLLGQLLHITL